MKSFAIILEDPNPLHLEPEAVRAMGMGDRVINQGPTGIGYIMNMLLDSAPGTSIEDLAVSLMANVFGGDRVIAGGRVVSISRLANERRVACEIWLDVENGARAILGTATLIENTSAS
jgi:acyl dehydratase